MRIKSIFAALALASVTAAAPHIPRVEDSCNLSISTVFATPSAIYLTVTVHDAPKSTIYITGPSVSYVPVDVTPTKTVTMIAISMGTTTALSNEVVSNDGVKLEAQSDSLYEATVTKTAIVTFTAGVSEKSAPDGPISFMVIDGTTTWLGGKTPKPDEPIVYASNIVTIVPIPQEFTTTLKSTVKFTSKTTITNTLVHSESSTTSSSGGFLTAVPTGGWNLSTVAALNAQSGFLTAGTAPQPSLAPTLVTEEPTFDLYPTTIRSDISVTSFAAKSGFKGYSTLTAPAVVSSSKGASTTAVVNGQTYSWILPTPSSSASSLTLPPYSNVTFTTSRTFNTPSMPTASIVPSSVSNATSLLSSTAKPSPTTGDNEISSVVSSSTSTTPTACGITGDFTLTFDDIPPLSIGNQSIDDVAPLPVFNSYHQFAFSNGFVVVPPPRVPYLPSSKPLLVEFIPNFSVNETDDPSNPNSRESGWSGDIANGDHGRTDCFNFNVYGASFGCDSAGPDCLFTFTGYRYEQGSMITSQVTKQTITVAACPNPSDLTCTLTSVTLDNTFQNLDIIRINVTVNGLPKLWWMDDVRLGWFDNSCTKGLCRQNTRIR